MAEPFDKDIKLIWSSAWISDPESQGKCEDRTSEEGRFTPAVSLAQRLRRAWVNRPSSLVLCDGSF